MSSSKARNYPLWIGGKKHPFDAKSTLPVRSPASGAVVAQTQLADRDQLEDAVRSSRQAFSVYRNSSRMARSALLRSIAQRIERRASEFISRMTEEAGKPRGLCEGEVQRSILTFTLASQEAMRLGGEVVPVDLDRSGRGFDPAVTLWVPRGPVLAITPFNFPLNLVAHKVGPALASGNTVILKPPPQAPGAGDLLAEIFQEACIELGRELGEEIPCSALQVIHARNDDLAPLIKDPRIPTISFTGSQRVGWMLQGSAIGKRVVLELGGNAAVLVHEDADLKRAAQRCAYGAFAYAGQICISVQRILVHERVLSEFTPLLLEETRKLGDLVGPVIDDSSARRILNCIEEAAGAGAKVLIGGKAKDRWIEPTILEGAREDLPIVCEEAFGPVALLDSYRTIEQGIEAANHSKFGLQAGVFTDSIEVMQKCIRDLEVGGVIINDVPTYRSDAMAYGGVKESGIGREGVRYAMEELSERKTCVSFARRGT